MKSSEYRYLLWEFIGALDTGKYDSLDIEDVKRHASAGTIQAFLVDRFGDDLDLSTELGDWTAINETWADIANAVDASRKFRVKNKGISLLLAYALEGLQRLEANEKKERLL
jgi:hypothetical protein